MSEQRSESRLRGVVKTALWLGLFLAFGYLVGSVLFQDRSNRGAAGGAANRDAWLVGKEDARVQELSRQYESLSFGLLGDYYYYSPDPWETPDPSLVRQSRIPDDIRALSGKRVALSGFMMPLDQDPDGATEFVLNGNYDMCGFGGPVSINQWVMVKYAGKGKVPFTHLPLTVFGTLDVGEEKRDGRVYSLYRMKADAVSTPEGVIE